MYTGKLALTNPNSTPLALQNDFNDAFGLHEDIEFSDTTEEMLEAVNSRSFYRKWKIARETSRYTRLESVDILGNVHYLLVYKEADHDKA